MIIDIPRIPDPRGNLSFIQNGSHIPFDIARAYWIYDVPGGELRDGHAFRTATELVVALSGSFDVVVTAADGSRRVTTLNRSYRGMLVEPMTWRSLENFSTNAVALVLSSTPYSKADYIRDFSEYQQLTSTVDIGNAKSTVPAAEVKSVAEKPREEKSDSQISDCSMVDAHQISRLCDCRVDELTRIRHANGSLTVVDNLDAPFPVRRVFYLYDVPGDAERGGHSHYEAEELIIAASGSFDVTITDGHDTRTVTLNRPYRALYIPAGIWRNLDNFSSGSVCLVLTSRPFSEADYCRDYELFKQKTARKIPLSQP